MFGQQLNVTVKKSLPAEKIVVAKKAIRIVVIMTNIMLKSRKVYIGRNKMKTLK
jgi:hypothetical protein